MLRSAFERHDETLRAFTSSGAFRQAERAAQLLLEATKRGSTVLVCGNGGSAADAQHFAAEWTCKYKDPRNPLPALALTTDTSALTAIGNDFGFEYVFSRQVEALGKKGDVLIALSTSGSSKNVLEAAKAARARGMRIIALTGASGLQDAGTDDVVVAIPSEETARIQEVHELVYHSWCETVDAAYV